MGDFIVPEYPCVGLLDCSDLIKIGNPDSVFCCNGGQAKPIVSVSHLGTSIGAKSIKVKNPLHFKSQEPTRTMFKPKHGPTIRTILALYHVFIASFAKLRKPV